MTNNSKKTNNNLLKETITIVKDKFWHDDIEILFKYDRNQDLENIDDIRNIVGWALKSAEK